MNFEDNIGRYIGRIHSLFSYKLNQLLRESEAGITVDQFRLLTHLWKQDGISQQQLAQLVRRDRASITRMVDILEQQGFINRASDKDDRRINLIFLTEKGKQLEPIASKAAEETLNISQKGFSQSERKTLDELLNRVISNLKE
jgi:MarR family transcriptional regulator, organic hydroperoxide resistance regulator